MRDVFVITSAVVGAFSDPGMVLISVHGDITRESPQEGGQYAAFRTFPLSESYEAMEETLFKLIKATHDVENVIDPEYLLGYAFEEFDYQQQIDIVRNYPRLARRTAGKEELHVTADHARFLKAVIGLAGEISAEVLPLISYDADPEDEVATKRVTKELGDAWWYWSIMSDFFNAHYRKEGVDVFDERFDPDFPFLNFGSSGTQAHPIYPFPVIRSKLTKSIGKLLEGAKDLFFYKNAFTLHRDGSRLMTCIAHCLLSIGLEYRIPLETVLDGNIKRLQARYPNAVDKEKVDV